MTGRPMYATGTGAAPFPTEWRAGGTTADLVGVGTGGADTGLGPYRLFGNTAGGTTTTGGFVFRVAGTTAGRTAGIGRLIWGEDNDESVVDTREPSTCISDARRSRVR